MYEEDVVVWGGGGGRVNMKQTRLFAPFYVQSDHTHTHSLTLTITLTLSGPTNWAGGGGTTPPIPDVLRLAWTPSIDPYKKKNQFCDFHVLIICNIR